MLSRLKTNNLVFVEDMEFLGRDREFLGRDREPALKVLLAPPPAILVLTSSANFRQTILTYFQQMLPIFPNLTNFFKVYKTPLGIFIKLHSPSP